MQHFWLQTEPPNNWSVLIGILIKYFMFKKNLSSLPSWEQKHKRERLFQSISTDVHGVLQLIQYQQKRNTRFLFPVTRAVWRIVLLKIPLLCVPSLLEGSCSFHSDTDTATLKGGWVACLSKFKCLDSKREKKKEMWKKVLI